MSFESEWILDVVQEWIDGYHMLREFGGGLPDCSRLDALLIPYSQDAHCMKKVDATFFERPRLVGIEVKASRADFMAGKRRGQLEKYQEHVSGLYLATFRGVCKTSEVPAGVGHLIVFKMPKDRRFRGRRCVCKRHPDYVDRPVAPNLAWRCLFRMRQEHNRALAEARVKQKKIMKELGRKASSLVFSGIRKLLRDIDAETARGADVSDGDLF